MAQVVEAVACGLHGFERRVAIKRLLPQHARDGERRRMFFEEARIGSRLHHGGIVPIFDYGIIDGAEFLAMEFVDGLDAMRAVNAHAAESQADAPGDEPAMPEGIALHIIAEIAHALAYVHGMTEAALTESGNCCESTGIVHRDVSPPNILLSWNGDVRLSDFGIALSGAVGGKVLGGVTGKLHYMAPEQARGEVVTAAADIYALGATLDALLGGRRVGATVTNDTPTASASDADRLEQTRHRGVSAETCALIEHCLASDPQERPTAAEVAARAGAIASARLGRDGRGALRDWLEPLRATAQRQGALDDLMGLSLVPVGPEAARTFTVTRLGDADADSAAPREAAPGALRARRTPKTAASLRSSLFMHASRALTAVGVAAATLMAWRLVHPHHQAIAADKLPPSVAWARRPPAEPRPAVDLPALPATELTEATEAPAPATTADIDPASETVSANAPAQRAHPTAAPVHPNGWIEVGGPTLTGGRVAVDGRFVGAAGAEPLRLQLPLGVHTVVVTAWRSGEVLLSRAVRVSARQTTAAPLRVVR
jgi:serine/threonine-protein kinase